ncbi:uncharacterized protein PRCAT00003387001 [Priceomyces carsonii]|uniref:uncharacterized protein n=1 Tax=Priceomyces carsonii TaxID=28549 RepID=UPI002EDA0BC0|nr:unnamed protein product [Priceomyces carsonii]
MRKEFVSPLYSRCSSILTALKWNSTRPISSTTDEKAALTLNEIAEKWTIKWKAMPKSKTKHENGSKSFYCLTMFPYPSGKLHMGHLRVYTINDVITRFKRLKGQQVIQPMGWDAFGLPAENAAVERGINPAVWTEENIKNMKEQMSMMLADFDWDREINTCSPDYYKWTQKLFLLLFEHGLAYRKKAEINWDPVDQTVLANEQVDANGKSWRSGAIVEKKKLRQWFIGITKYADALNEDLNILKEWPLKVKSMQKHWIGKSYGAEIEFLINDISNSTIPVFTSRPDTIFGVQFLALALDHPLTVKLARDDPKLQLFIEELRGKEVDTTEGYLIQNLRASIPIDVHNHRNEKFEIPIYVAPYVLSSYGTGAVMGCPGHDERDFKFWNRQNPDIAPIQVVGNKDLELAIRKQDLPFTEKDGVLYDSSVLNNGRKDMGNYRGMPSMKAAKEVLSALESQNLGKDVINYRLRDWLISRQRYWGAPIPIIHCEKCGPQPAPDLDLPVVLPPLQGHKFTKGNPLANLESFVKAKCPSCGADSKRETDTMDTFMDSSWYFFRYLDNKNKQRLFDPKKVNENMPVDMYIGGIEHAILHLLYSRFISKFLGDIGLWSCDSFRNEPFKKLVTQGMVHGETFTDPETNRFLKPEELDLSNPTSPKIKSSGMKPNITYEKMSKSKFNGADPAEYISKYGPDATRALILFQAPISDVLNWNESQIHGIKRWLNTVISLPERINTAFRDHKPKNEDSNHTMTNFKNIKINEKIYNSIRFNELDFNLFREVQEFIERIAESIEIQLSFNTIISDYMKLTNLIVASLKGENTARKEIILDAYKTLLIGMYPVTPCVSEECWERICITTGRPWSSISEQLYPKSQRIDSPFIRYNVFINGKARLLFQGNKSLIELEEKEIFEIVCSKENTRKYVTGELKRLIVKPGMISIVTTH